MPDLSSAIGEDCSDALPPEEDEPEFYDALYWPEDIALGLADD